MLDTYNAPYPDGTIAQGGYASHVRAHEYFTFPIPKNIPSEIAAPMMCAGLTTWSPLVRAGTGPGKKVAVLGMLVIARSNSQIVLANIVLVVVWGTSVYYGQAL